MGNSESKFREQLRKLFNTQEDLEITNLHFKYLFIANLLAFIVVSIIFGIYIIAYVVPTEKKKLFVLSDDAKGVDKFKETKPTQLLLNPLKIWRRRGLQSDWAKIWRHVHNIFQLENVNYNKSSVVNWFAIKAPEHENYIYYGKDTVDAIINGLWMNQTSYDQTISSAREMYPNGMDIETFHQSFERLNGLWRLGYTRDHGVELAVSQIILEEGASKFILRKVTGDPNLPRREITIKTEGIPIVGNLDLIDAQTEARFDINNPNELKWESAKMRFPDEDTIEDIFMGHENTIKRYKPNDEMEGMDAVDTHDDHEKR